MNVATGALAEENERLKRELGRMRSQVVEAERAKTEYMQNVAHQLAAPINAIKMNIEAVNNPRVAFDRKKELFRSIYAQGTILAHLIKNFSLMSHLEAGHSLDGFRDKPESVNPCQICINYSNDFQPIGRHKGQQIYVDEVSFDKAGRPQIFVVKNLFAQVVYNLLENATKYGDEESKIVIGFQSDSKYTVVSVKSEGIPIAPDERSKLFERGSRGKLAKDLHPAGTGFGLFIANRIMAIHHGTLDLQVHGRETTFLIKCPKTL